MKMTEQRFWDSDREFVLTYSLMATVCSAICHDEISEWRQDALRRVPVHHTFCGEVDYGVA